MQKPELDPNSATPSIAVSGTPPTLGVTRSTSHKRNQSSVSSATGKIAMHNIKPTRNNSVSWGNLCYVAKDWLRWVRVVWYTCTYQPITTKKPPSPSTPTLRATRTRLLFVPGIVIYFCVHIGNGASWKLSVKCKIYMQQAIKFICKFFVEYLLNLLKYLS